MYTYIYIVYIQLYICGNCHDIWTSSFEVNLQYFEFSQFNSYVTSNNTLLVSVPELKIQISPNCYIYYNLTSNNLIVHTFFLIKMLNFNGLMLI